MSILEELNCLVKGLKIPVETAVYSESTSETYVVLTPLSDEYGTVLLPQLQDLADGGTTLLGKFASGMNAANGDFGKMAKVIGSTVGGFATTGRKKDIKAYPSSWADSFGNNYYRQAQALELAAFESQELWNVTEEGQPFGDNPFINVTSADVIGTHIQQMIGNMKQEVTEDGI